MKGPDAPIVPDLDFHACPAAIDTYGKLFRAGPPNAQGLRPLADAVIGITGYSGYFLAEDAPAAKITIGTQCAYPARTVVVTFGQRLEIDNASKIAFAPRLDGVTMAAVMIAPPGQNGGPVKIYPPRTGRFQLIDTLQPFITEDLFVVRQPLHAVSDLSGHYRIDKVPVGKLKVSAHLPATNAGAEADVDVRPDVVEKVDLTITYAPSDAGVMSRPRGPLIP
jgi:hypothetical protein